MNSVLICHSHHQVFELCHFFKVDISQKDRWMSKEHCTLTIFVFNRGKMLLGYSDAELANLGGYDLVHYDDLAYVASAHQERKLHHYSPTVARPFNPLLHFKNYWILTSDDVCFIFKRPWFQISGPRPTIKTEFLWFSSVNPAKWPN